MRWKIPHIYNAIGISDGEENICMIKMHDMARVEMSCTYFFSVFSLLQINIFCAVKLGLGGVAKNITVFRKILVFPYILLF